MRILGLISLYGLFLLGYSGNCNSLENEIDIKLGKRIIGTQLLSVNNEKIKITFEIKRHLKITNEETKLQHSINMVMTPLTTDVTYEDIVSDVAISLDDPSPHHYHQNAISQPALNQLQLSMIIGFNKNLKIQKGKSVTFYEHNIEDLKISEAHIAGINLRIKIIINNVVYKEDIEILYSEGGNNWVTE